MYLLYSILLLIHVLAAIIGLGVTFAFPVIANSAKNLPQLKQTLTLMKRLEKFPQIGGVLFTIGNRAYHGNHNTNLFHKSLVRGLNCIIYFNPKVDYFVIGSKMKKVVPLVMSAEGEEIPYEYKVVAKSTAPIHLVTIIGGIIIIVLMSAKPF